MKKAVLVTGSNGGIGTSICKSLLVEGYVVIGIDLDSDKNQLPEYLTLDLDRLVTDSAYRDAKLAELLTIVGAYRLVGLVNNAAAQILGGIIDLSVEDFSKTLNINVLSAFIFSQSLFESLKESGGAIVNIGSIHALLTKPNFLAYSTSKTALHGLTKAMAVEFGEFIKVNAIAPSAIDTPMLKAGFENAQELYDALNEYHPTKRIGDPSEISKLVLFLIKESVGFINGSIIEISGGVGSVLHDPA